MTDTWLITGAAGFIGSNLCEYLLEKDQNVIGVDNFSTGSLSNLERLDGLSTGNFFFVERDIREVLDTHTFGANVDNVIHLAAQVSVQKSIDDPEETYLINEVGFRNVAQLVKKISASAFVYASSCAIYGDNPNLPLDESSAPHPLSPYANSKLQNELDGAEICRKLPFLSVVGLRFFNIFGPWQDFKSGYAAVIAKWIQCLMSGSKPIMYGDGGAQRDYCYVRNVCDAIWLAATAKQKFSNEVFNVGTGVATDLNELFQTMRDAVVLSGNPNLIETIEKRPWREGDIVNSFADVSKIRMALGLVPNITLSQGIERILRIEYGGALNGVKK